MFESIAVGLLWWTISGGVAFVVSAVLVESEDMPDWLGYATTLICGPIAWLIVAVLVIELHNRGGLH